MISDEMINGKIESIQKGKALFDKLIGRGFKRKDKYVLVFTKDREWVNVTTMLYPDLKAKSGGRVYVFAENRIDSVGEKEMIQCSDEELAALADYSMLFTEDFRCNENFILIVDDDRYGSNVEELMRYDTISVEEYIRTCLMKLD